MARITKPLTNTQIEKTKPKDKEYSLYDGEGLMLRVKPNGTKSWIFNYSRPYTKKRANLSLGKYPALSLKAARKCRTETLEQLVQNIDPKDVRLKKQREGEEAYKNTLKFVSERWMLLKRTSVTPDYADDIWRSLMLHVFPSIGDCPISQLTAPTVIDVLKPLEAKGSLETVKRVIQRLNEIMIYAVNTGILQGNPLGNIHDAFLKPERSHMPTIKPQELPQLIRDLIDANLKPITKHLILWSLHTLVRPKEAAGARWEEIDFDAKEWRIPAERMKKKRPHTVPLTPEALSILMKMKNISGNREHIFPGDRKPRAHTNEQTANSALKRMGYKGKLVAHGLRSIGSTYLNEKLFDKELVEVCLAHVDNNQTRSAYNRTDYLEERRAIMAAWSTYIVCAQVEALRL